MNEQSELTTAEKLFPSMAPQRSEATHRPPETSPGLNDEQKTAVALFPIAKQLPPEDLPPAIRELRETDPARAMFDDGAAYAESGLDKLLEAQGIIGEAQQAELRAWNGMLADHQIRAHEARELVEIASMPATDEAVEAWRGDAERALARDLGPGWKASQDFRDAQRLIARDPRLADYLARSGLGSHPRVVKLAIEKARSERLAGRLKG